MFENEFIERHDATAIGKYIFVRTCSACPEQYDVFDLDGSQVAYVRLRGGYLYAQCPDYGGHTVYEAEPDGDGCFASETERQYHLFKIAEAISQYHNHIDASYQ